MSNIESRKREFLNNLEVKVHRVLGCISIVLTGKPYITEPDPTDNPPPNGAPQRTKDRYSQWTICQRIWERISYELEKHQNENGKYGK